MRKASAVRASSTATSSGTDRKACSSSQRRRAAGFSSKWISSICSIILILIPASQELGMPLKPLCFRRARRESTRLVEKGRRSSVRVDEAHLATQNIDELWEGFDARKSKRFGKQRRLLSPDRQCVVRVVHQSPESQHLKPAAPESDARLLYQNRPRAFYLDRERHQQHQRCRDRQ